jgi:hypothetical protein
MIFQHRATEPSLVETPQTIYFDDRLGNFFFADGRNYGPAGSQRWARFWAISTCPGRTSFSEHPENHQRRFKNWPVYELWRLAKDNTRCSKSRGSRHNRVVTLLPVDSQTVWILYPRDPGKVGGSGFLFSTTHEWPKNGGNRTDNYNKHNCQVL